MYFEPSIFTLFYTIAYDKMVLVPVKYTRKHTFFC